MRQLLAEEDPAAAIADGSRDQVDIFDDGSVDGADADGPRGRKLQVGRCRLTFFVERAPVSILTQERARMCI